MKEKDKKHIESEFEAASKLFLDLHNRIEKLEKIILELQQKLVNVDQRVSPKTAEDFRDLAEKTYIKLAGELIKLAGENKEEAEKTMKIMKEAGFDREDMQLIPILETALWGAYNSRFSV